VRSFWIDSSSSTSRIVALSGMKQRIGTSRTALDWRGRYGRSS
jgi:hypothetical protein